MKRFPGLKSRIVLAPMHSVTNLAFRLMCKKYGAGLVSTELLSANALARENNAVMKLAKTDRSEKPVAIQLFSQNTENLKEAVRLAEKNFDIIDFNLGCPSNRIMQQGSGGALLKRKNKIEEIMNALIDSSKKPVTVKIRSGFDKRNINAVEISKICENAGASAITVHARSVDQGYSGKADWSVIRAVKETITIPVIGNGDVVDGESAKKMLEETKCDYAMVGRAAIGNPFIFRQIDHYLKTGERICQTKEEKIGDYLEYIELSKKFEIFGVRDAKIKAQEFIKGINGSRSIKRNMNKIKTWEDIEKAIIGIQNN